MAFVLAMLMFSLAGIPPLAGFFAKWYVFVAAIEARLYALAVIGVLASVVGAYYYLRIVKVMYFDEPREAFVPASATLKHRHGRLRHLQRGLLALARSAGRGGCAAAKSLF